MGKVKTSKPDKKDNMNNDIILAPYVKKIWSIQNYNLQKGTKTFRFLPDGCPGLMFQDSDSSMFLNGTKKLANFFIYGQTVKPISISVSGNYKIVMIYLYPHVVKTLFGLNAKELTDKCLDVSLALIGQKYAITEKLLNEKSEINQIELLKMFMVDLISDQNYAMDLEMQAAVSKIESGGGTEMIRNVQEQLQLSERTFIRKFESHVGLTPKLFSNICRFRKALERIESGDFEKLSDVGFESGYADQSHFIRSFKEFAGETPKAFLKYYDHL